MTETRGERIKKGESDCGYPFLDDWLRRQSEPLPESGIDWSQFRPTKKERLPDKTKETLFDRKEVLNQ